MISGYLKFIRESLLLKLKDNVDEDMISKIQSVSSPPSRILEISCGNGSDSLYLKNLGFEVKTTEINDEYVTNANKLGLSCVKHDTENSFPFKSNEFDLIYCRLGLHYFKKDQLFNIFSEIGRICKYLIFSVKLVDDDSLYLPQGRSDCQLTNKLILSVDDWIEITESKFTILDKEIKSGVLYGKESRWIEILAIRK